MKEKCDVAVLLVNFNNNEDTIDAVKSIQKSEDIEFPYIVVVDNDSNRKDILEVLSFYPHLKVIYSDVNIGFGRANNLGLEWIYDNLESEYIFILNNDTIVEKTAINKLILNIKKSSFDVEMVAPKILVESNKTEIWYGGGDFNFKKITPNIFSDKEAGYTEFASGCAMFFKTSSLKKYKGFDPFFFMYDEDVELSMRIKNSKNRILYTPESIIYHKCQGSQIKENNISNNQLHPNHPGLIFYLNNTILNRRYIIKKHLSGTKKILATINHNIYWVMKAGQYLLYGKIKAALVVLKNLSRGLPAYI